MAKLTKAQGRELVRAAVRPGASKRAVAEEFDVTPQRVYQLVQAALEDPAAAREAAWAEYVFRSQIERLVEGDYGGE